MSRFFLHVDSALDKLLEKVKSPWTTFVIRGHLLCYKLKDHSEDLYQLYDPHGTKTLFQSSVIATTEHTDLIYCLRLQSLCHSIRFPRSFLLCSAIRPAAVQIAAYPCC